MANTRKKSKRRRVGERERIAERRLKALVLRRARATYRQVATELKISVSTAFDDVAAEMAVGVDSRGQQAEFLRTEEVDHLDAISRALWPARGDTASARALIAASERRSKLLGLDAQTTGASAEEILQTAATLVTIIQAHVRDQRIIDAIAEQFESALARLAPQRLTLVPARSADDR